MQLNKSIQNLSEIAGCSASEDILLSSYQRVLKSFRLNGINRMLNGIKSSGLSGAHIFQTLFVLPFLNIKNIHRLFHCGVSSLVFGDDNAYYRFLNNPLVPWRKVMTAFIQQYIKAVDRISIDQCETISPQCLICDDSILEKSGFKMETIGKVFDHCCHKYLLGIKLLVLGLWDGKSFVPLDFSLHHEPGKNKNRGLKAKQLKAQHSYTRPSESPGHQRIKEVSQSKITMAIEMIKRVAKSGLSFEYVLADSWFISEGFIRDIRTICMKDKSIPHVIGLMKTNRTIGISGKTYKINSLPELNRRSIKYCKKLKCKYIPFNASYKGIDIQIFLICMQGQQSWKALICTDKKCAFIKAMEIYQIRWSIEVFFKDSKQYLNLGKCQSTNFDAQIASITLCFMNYTSLALIKRVDDYESIGLMFMHLKDLIVKDHIVKKIWNIIITIYVELLSQLGVDLNIFIAHIINSNSLRNQMTLLYGSMMNLDYSKQFDLY
jgi:hypothetical protein